MPQSDTNVEALQTQQEQEDSAATTEELENQSEASSEPEATADVDSDDIRVSEANNIVKNYVIGAMGISLVPIPLVDLVALSGIQLKMLHSLARLYQIPFSENLGKSLIVSLVGGVMPTTTALTLASFAKALPVVGTATGMVSVSVLGGATTYAIGNVFIQHFESGGTLLDFDPKEMREYFTNKFQEGKKAASRWKKTDDTTE